MPAKRRLDLTAIERALREVQSRFDELSQHFIEQREPFSDEVLQNMLEGYALVDDYVARGVDLFDLQQVNLLLEINTTVLCGSDPGRRLEFAEHLEATEQHFFNEAEGGIKDLYNWYSAHRNESVWKRAAGVYVRILSKPQLFIEGNNRSGSLIVSYLLMRAGRPPFVLTVYSVPFIPAEDSTSSCFVTTKRSVSSPIAIEIFLAALSLIVTGATGSNLVPVVPFPP